MTNRELWQNTLVQIELGTSETSFRTWFRNTDIVHRDANTVQIAVPSKIVKEWLMEKHQLSLHTGRCSKHVFIVYSLEYQSKAYGNLSEAQVPKPGWLQVGVPPPPLQKG